MSEHRREHRRIAVDIPIRVRHLVTNAEVDAAIRNISLGGVFVAMDEPFEFGVDAELEFQVPNTETAIKCRGFVAWTTGTSPGRVDVPGMGIRFIGLGIRDLRVISDFIEAKVRQEGS